MTCEELLIKWRPVIHATWPIWSWTEQEVLAVCAEIASKSTHMIECGSYLGKSAKVMLMANPDLHLLCVDTFETAGLEHTFRYFLRDEILSGRCRICVGNSVAGAQAWLTSWETVPVLDAVWVDDGHSESDLVRDITAFMTILKPGGIMFGHDFDQTNDVARGVLSQFKLEQLTFPHPRVWCYQKP